MGAAELLLGVEDGGDTEIIALAALPYADDAEIALGALADRIVAERAAGRGAGPRVSRILTAILGIAGRPPRQRERLDPEGLRRAGEVVLAIAKDASAAEEVRATAISAARALAEHGAIDRARVPD